MTDKKSSVFGEKGFVRLLLLFGVLLLATVVLKNIAGQKPADIPPPPVYPSPTIKSGGEGSFSWVSSSNNKLIDRANQVIILKGFVTLSNYTNGQPVRYQPADYKRMKEWGANYQSIRIGAGNLGGWSGAEADPVYLSRLDRMVNLGKEAGLYSNFKLTIYDIGDFRGLSKNRAWKKLWENKGSEQEKLISAWKKLWEKYKDEPAIIGYDLLNEPEKGSLDIGEEVFIASYLAPFYQKAIDELRAIDPEHLVIFQPPYGAPPFNASLNRSGTVYAPHFYPNLVEYLKGDFSTASYESTIGRFRNEANLNNSPLLIGEYGMPWDEKNDGNKILEEKYRNLEETALGLFNRYNLSYSRPWFVDDKAGVNLGKIRLNWAVIKGDGLQGEERKIIIDPFRQSIKN